MDKISRSIKNDKERKIGGIMGLLMGIDLGTSSVKVMISDETGTIKGFGQKGYEILTPHIGYAEQNPVIWWECTKKAIQEAVFSSEISGKDIIGIGFSGQMHGMVAMDKEKNLVDSAIIHLDQRSLMEKEEIIRAAGELMEEELLNQPCTGMLICSLLWVKKQKPDIYEKISCVMSPKDYIRYKLTGVVCTDFNDASGTLAFSVKKRSWCMELIRRLGIKEDIWPDVYPSCQIVGTVKESISLELGISVNAKVVAGGGDCAAQLIGNGVIEEGTLSCNIGTASQLAVVTGKSVFDKKMRCQLWCHSIPDLWVFQGGALNGGNTLSWLKNKALKDRRPFMELDQEAYQIPAGCEGLVFLPYLAGERTPYNNPLARGAFFGLGLKHDQAYLVRAVMEGVMFNLRECKKVFDELGIPQNKLVASGGAAKGKCWKQIQADVMDMPVHTTLVEEEACFGAVIMAAVGVGIYGDMYSACRETVKWNPEVTEPIVKNVKIYQEKQQIFSQLYKSVENIFPKL